MRLKITIAYDGTDFHGWQRQPSADTVQGLLEAAASRIADAPTRVHGASRTDAGVHASGQVAHLDTGNAMSAAAWQRSLNSLLPASVRIVDAHEASDEFHARHSSVRKTYRYEIDTAAVASPFLVRRAWHVPQPLDLGQLRLGASTLLTDLDQRAFATRPEPGPTHRPLATIAVIEEPTLTVRVAGRSFLRYAVRGMVGALVAVGRGELDPEALAVIARSGDRKAAPAPAPPHGLCLERVEYAES